MNIALNNDSVALERTEVLRLELELISPNQICSPNIFFVDEATIEIIDTTGTFILYCSGADLGIFKGGGGGGDTLTGADCKLSGSGNIPPIILGSSPVVIYFSIFPNRHRV